MLAPQAPTNLRSIVSVLCNMQNLQATQKKTPLTQRQIKAICSAHSIRAVRYKNRSQDLDATFRKLEQLGLVEGEETAASSGPSGPSGGASAAAG